MATFRFRILLMLLVLHTGIVNKSTASSAAQSASSTDFTFQQPNLGPIRSAAWNSDGSRIATGHVGAEIGIWDGSTGQYITALPIAISQLPTIDLVFNVRWSSDDNRLSFTTGDSSLTVTGVMDSLTGQLLLTLPDEAASHWNINGTEVLTLNRIGQYPFAEYRLRIRNAATGDLLSEFMPTSGGVFTWSPDSRQIAIARGKEVDVWNVSSATVVLQLQGHSDAILGIDWSPDGSKLATSSQDFTARIWDVTTGQRLISIPLMSHGDGILWSPDGSTVSVWTRPFVQIFDPLTGEILSDQFVSLIPPTWSPDGTRLLASENEDAPFFTIVAPFGTPPTATLTSSERQIGTSTPNSPDMP
jgi:WD40 repeat protein